MSGKQAMRDKRSNSDSDIKHLFNNKKFIPLMVVDYLMNELMNGW
jgi:hypothetical protein